MATEEFKPRSFEHRWQERWEELGLYRAHDFSSKPKYYVLVEFPYPSGDGLHVGHTRSYSALDALARKKRMGGYEVLFPMGWDAFGLPTENYALRTGIHPQEATKKNVATFKRQIRSLGLSFDWEREINTTDPEYYRWTQWIFLKLFEHNLAYQAEIPINWCPSCRIGLANEEIISGNCERCGAKTEKRNVSQWMLRITDYADRLLEDLNLVDYSPRIRLQQENWIGRSEGTTIYFPLDDGVQTINVFTTRPDTLLGVTAMVVAPEHPLVDILVTPENKEACQKYITKAQHKSDFERTELDRDKSGVFSGSYCLNPVSGERIPIWIADYVVATYGGGAVMVVPAHDQRDYDFAKKYGIEIREVISGGSVANAAYTGDGLLINSGEFNGLPSLVAREKVTVWLETRGRGAPAVNYKLRDWVFSRQHYWGEPIPIIHCEKCGAVPVLEEDLPVELPFVEKYEPSRTGESPLANIKGWVEVPCPHCGGAAKRETDTMPNWAGSSWYFLRYLDPKNTECPVSFEKAAYWLPVDLYNGGMEHTTLHVLYSRFWHKFLFDIGIVNTPEPYLRRRSHGVVLAEDGRKMSKSFGNVVSPDEIVSQFGADTLRLYEMFMGPFEQMIRWDSQGVEGMFRFLARLWRLLLGRNSRIRSRSTAAMFTATNVLIKRVGDDLERMHFNTAISALMEYVNLLAEEGSTIGKDDASSLICLLAPFAPHTAEEIYSRIFPDKYAEDQSFSVHKQPWPKYDSQVLEAKSVELVVQVSGKVRAKLTLTPDVAADEKTVRALAEKQANVIVHLAGKGISGVVFVPKRLINFVTT